VRKVNRAVERWGRRDPRATASEQRRARSVVDSLARKFATQGAEAVVLGGSWARGDAHRASDIDLWVLGRRYGTSTLFTDGFPVHVERTTERIERARFREPRRVGGSVPGWRSAVLLYDPRGVAAKLKAEARAFRWSPISDRCDRWVADQVVDWAEEAIKLVRALGEGSLETAAVQRNLLANRLLFVMAVHRRILWGSENEAWERVGRRIGGRWHALQRRALGLNGGDVARTGRAALDLDLRAADAVRGLLGPEAVSVVEHARGVIDGTAPVLGR
jgi:predicted nucleotidyltransferase